MIWLVFIRYMSHPLFKKICIDDFSIELHKHPNLDFKSWTLDWLTFATETMNCLSNNDAKSLEKEEISSENKTLIFWLWTNFCTLSTKLISLHFFTNFSPAMSYVGSPSIYLWHEFYRKASRDDNPTPHHWHIHKQKQFFLSYLTRYMRLV